MSKRQEKKAKRDARRAMQSSAESLAEPTRALPGQRPRPIQADDDQPFVALKYYDRSFQCFSDWNAHELKAFSHFVEILGKSSWDRLPTGLERKVHKNRYLLPDKTVLRQLSPDVAFFEMRVTQRARVHGFRAKSVFYLVWLDKDHAIYP